MVATYYCVFYADCAALWGFGGSSYRRSKYCRIKWPPAKRRYRLRRWYASHFRIIFPKYLGLNLDDETSRDPNLAEDFINTKERVTLTVIPATTILLKRKSTTRLLSHNRL